MTKKLALLVGLLLLTAAPAHSQSQERDAGQDPNENLQDLEVRLTPHKGDIDEMEKRRVVRALVSFNRVGFFYDNGRPRGMSYDALMDLQKFLNKNCVPTTPQGKRKSMWCWCPQQTPELPMTC